MSFSAEISDFINGFKAGAAVGGDFQDRKLAREKWEAEKAQDEAANARANRALDIRERSLGSRAAAKWAKASEATRKADAKAAEKAHKDEVRDFNETAKSGGGGSGGSKAAAPVYSDEWDDAFPDDSGGDTYEDTGDEDTSSLDVTDEEITASYAEGGLATDGEDEEEQALPIPTEGKGDVESALPVPGAAPQKAEQTARATDDPVFKEAAAVVKETMDQWNAEAGQPEAAVDPAPKKSQDRVSAVAPASPAEMKAMWETVDPNGELDSQVKGAKTLVKAYNFFMSKGDAVKAKKIAAQIIKFNQMASMTQGQLALEALRQGDLQSASRLVTDAANENVPDGVTIQAKPTPKGTILYKIDKAGAAQQQGELGAKQLWELAAGVADGSMYIKRMAALAGEAAPTSESNGEAIPAEPGKKKRRSYSADVATAAQARRSYDAIKDKYDQAVADGLEGEELKALEDQLHIADGEWKSAWKVAQRAAKATKRPRKTLLSDFKMEMSAPDEGMPEESAIPTDSKAAVKPAEPSVWNEYASAIGYSNPIGLGLKAGRAIGGMFSGETAAPEAAPSPGASMGRPMDQQTLANAKAAIAQGRSREGVMKKLQEAGFSTEGL